MSMSQIVWFFSSEGLLFMRDMGLLTVYIYKFRSKKVATSNLSTYVVCIFFQKVDGSTRNQTKAPYNHQ